MVIRRMLTVTGTTFVVLMLTASSAFAHLCFNASRSDTGNANAANGQALFSGPELFGLLDFLGCEEESDALEDAVWAAYGDPANILVNANAVMAGGVVGTDHSFDGVGIDHLLLVWPEFEAAIECAFGAEG